MKHILFTLTLLLSISLTANFTEAQQLTIYSGRSKALVDPLIQEFEKETGIQIRIRYGGTTQLAVALMEEGKRSPADLFWAQDAGALGAVHQAGLLQKLPEYLSDDLPEIFKNSDFTWIATSGRARVLAYNKNSVGTDQLPQSIYDLTKPQWNKKAGWAPANASFQSFVTAMRKIEGEERTREWLLDMKNNNTVAYNNNTSILQAISAGEIEIGITNHYYIARAKNSDSNYPVEEANFVAGDTGNLINVAGIGILNSSSENSAAIRFVEFLLSKKAQEFFQTEVFEYAVSDELDNESLKRMLEITPKLDLDILRDLEETLNLLREVGLL